MRDGRDELVFQAIERRALGQLDLVFPLAEKRGVQLLREVADRPLRPNVGDKGEAGKNNQGPGKNFYGRR